MLGGPPTVDSAEADVCERILAIFDSLTRMTDLEPGSAVNSLFAELVRICEYRPAEDAEQVLNDPRITAVRQRLREMCANAEFLLERSWARRVIDTAHPDEQLATFPYLSNYEELTALELHALAGVGCDLTQVRRICFLGGGPLPLSAMLMSRTLSVPVDVVDVSGEATALGSSVARRVSMSTQLQFHQANADAFDGVADSDLVVLAALVGLDRGVKTRVLKALSARMRTGRMLVIRSSHGLRTLLYPPLELSDLRDWRPLVVVHPLNAVVNSVVVATRR